MKKINALSMICIIIIVMVGACTSPPRERIAFVRFHKAEPIPNSEIYVMDTDGSNITQLTFNESHSHNPAWSPDGTRIAFDSRREGTRQIYIMDADGENAVRLTDEIGFDPAWSPDGQHVTFTCIVDSTKQICMMNADGTNIVQLTNEEIATASTWSPDGTRIAFECPLGPVQICVMDVDGSNLIRLTEGPWANFWPAWSPDGNRIAFVSNRDFGYDIFVMDADGSNIVQLVSSNNENTSPSWSPDGQHIVFTCDDGICVISLDDKRVQQLVDTGFDPVWTP
jgi:Tol biopolymer transport system component